MSETGIPAKKKRAFRRRKGAHFATRDDLSLLGVESILPPDGLIGKISNRTGGTGRDSLFSISGKVETYVARLETSSYKFLAVSYGPVLDGDIPLDSQFIVT